MARADIVRTATVDGSGNAVISFAPDTSKWTWTVQQVSPEMTGAPGEAIGQIRKNGALVAPFEPGGDAVAGEPYITLRLGDTMTVEWSNCNPGDVGQALIIYDDGVPA